MLVTNNINDTGVIYIILSFTACDFQAATHPQASQELLAAVTWCKKRKRPFDVCCGWHPSPVPHCPGLLWCESRHGEFTHDYPNSHSSFCVRRLNIHWWISSHFYVCVCVGSSWFQCGTVSCTDSTGALCAWSVPTSSWLPSHVSTFRLV